MSGVDLSIVTPIYNERRKVAPTVAAIDRALAAAGSLRAELVIVDDGSTDGTGAEAAGVESTVPVRVVTQPRNLGRFRARLAGLEAARGEYVLLLDAGALLTEGSLRFVAERLPAQPVWNGHTIMASDGDAYERFWESVSAIAFGAYVGDPRTTSYGAREFDRYPKGSGCFFAPRALMLEAFSHFTSYYADVRHSSDDTGPLRWLAARTPINISPGFAFEYRFDETFRGFVRHAFHRGLVFLDGHGRRDSRFLPAVLAFYPASAAVAALTVMEPVVLPGALVAVGLAAGGYGLARRRPPADAAALAALAPVYAVAHGLGMWRGLTLAAAHRLRR